MKGKEANAILSDRTQRHPASDYEARAERDKRIAELAAKFARLSRWFNLLAAGWILLAVIQLIHLCS